MSKMFFNLLKERLDKYVINTYIRKRNDMRYLNESFEKASR